MKKWMMISFAAGCMLALPVPAYAGTWVQEENQWHYTHDDGREAYDEFITEGNDTYYIDGIGVMARDQAFWLRDQFYYADEKGRLAKNQWMQLRNAEGETCWYYFKEDGRAQRQASSHVVAEIDGKKYIFNQEGEMQYGWVNKDGTRVNEAEEPLGWQQAVYYCGTESEGWIHTGWMELEVAYEGTYSGPKDGPVDWELEEKLEAESEYKLQKKKFFFRDSGLKYNSSESLYQKDQYGDEYAYKFDSFGVLTSTKKTSKDPSNTKKAAKYIDPVWEEVKPSYSESKENNYDFEYDIIRFKYKKKDKSYAKNELLKIDGKYYLFDEKSIMREGLYAIYGKSIGNSAQYIGDNCVCLYCADQNPDYAYQEDFEDVVRYSDAGYKIMYFTPGKGSSTSGTVKVRLGDDNPYTMKFNSSGVGLDGVHNGKLYHGGILIQADGKTLDYDYKGTTYRVNKNGKVLRPGDSEYSAE